MASISVMKTTVNDDKPRLQTRLQIPGLHALPKLSPMNDAQSARLSDNGGVAIKYDPSNADDYSIYTGILDEIKAEYSGEADTPFDVNSLGPCGSGNYGYDTSSPCVWIRLNKVTYQSSTRPYVFQVIDWTPVGYFAPTEAQGFTAASLNSRMEKDAVYVRCESKEVESDTRDVASFEYFGGTDGNLESKYYPFTGKKAQPNYEQPIVAVKINGLKVRYNFKILLLTLRSAWS